MHSWNSRNNEIIEISPQGDRKIRFTPTSAADTPNAIEQLCLGYKEVTQNSKLPALISVANFVFDFLSIHPFRDVNGRVSRLLTPLLLCGVSYGNPTEAEQSARARITEIVKLINQGDRAVSAKYVETNFSPKFLEMPVKDHLNFLDECKDWWHGGTIQEVQKEAPSDKDGHSFAVAALIKTHLTGELASLVLEVEQNPPYHVVSLWRKRPALVKENRIQERLSKQDIAKELEKYLHTLAKADLFSGAVLLAHHGRVFYKHAFGPANRDYNVPNLVDTKFNLGSMNKMFTAVAIAQLVEAGKLSFDDPLFKFLPDFPSKSEAKKIKIKHLLSHTSGLGSYFNKMFMESSRARFRTVDDMMTLTKDEKLAFEPETKWAYSNTGFLALGAVIEKASKISYFDYIRKYIYEPTGMTNSDCYELDRVTPNLAVGYEKEYSEQGSSFKNNLFAHVIRGGPAGGGYSTVEDLLKFATALTTHKLISKTSTDFLLSPKSELNSPHCGYGFEINPDTGSVGHGGGFMGISSNLGISLKN